ncbi:putative fructose-amino acid permease [Paenibacillus mucilaginosus 3016]|uniref:Putative fructose-amino acid permease n=1 Tax=Paenibacillus mucilaginosus 3016 TaxID=1116391 RepID=H6NNA1_9BACL|nr:carbohydrate ABC transporter permease [Paenibacillus mucilaginosus]AFC31777.1 putative fructose-amino acid permease [Paenibacillus mucilaginosus 3016]WFA20293.1 carbohydrate ABC transporter permease [Paenibacillus mucilaginosus]
MTTLPAALSRERTRRRSYSAASVIGTVCVSLLLLLYFLAVAYPLFWMVISSFKETNDIYSRTWSLPAQWMFSNYTAAWKQGLSDYFMNSVIVTGMTVVFNVLFSAFSAYGLSRFSFRGKHLILALLSAGLMFSPQVSLIPLYKLVQAIGIYDTHWTLILPYVAFKTSLIVLLIRSFFVALPKEYEESAYLEGCTSLGILFRIFLPLSMPIILTAALQTAYYAWNEFMFAIIFVDSDAVKTITAGLMAFRDALSTDWGVLMAGLTLSALPLVTMFVAMQKVFIRGLGDGGVKG